MSLNTDTSKTSDETVRSDHRSAVVTVIVPIHSGTAQVERSLRRLVDLTSRGSTEARLLLINDASPEPEMGPMLLGLSGRQHPMSVELITNESNLGFVETVNLGITSSTGDVVILNADTTVTKGWLDRLAEAAKAPNVATVTPLTNFGSLCTLPHSIRAHFELDGETPRVDECAEHIARHGLGLRPEVISGVGFCMYVTRSAIDLVGLLDVATFGRGYGEEVDFCIRAGRIGLRHLVEDSTFVHHEGGSSFGDSRTERMAAASALVHERYPFFRAANRAERSDDPLRVPFAALELGLSSPDPGRRRVLQVLHSGPSTAGGTQKHLQTLLDATGDEFDHSVFYPTDSGFVLRVSTRSNGEVVEHELLLPGGPVEAIKAHDHNAAAALQMALDIVEPHAVHLQNLVHHSVAPLEVLTDFDGPVVCSVRDLLLACPHHWLLYRNQEQCGIPDDPAVCAMCLPETRRWELDVQTEFRSLVASRFDTVDHWVLANPTVEDFLGRVYAIPSERIVHIEHGAIIDHERRPRQLDIQQIHNEPLRFAMVGTGWPKKGIDLVSHLAEVFADDPRVEFHHFGLLKVSAPPSVICHGPFDNEILPELLDAAGVQVVFLPGPYAETFGHVMTEALIAGRPVLGIPFGALGERIRRHRSGWTVDPSDWEGAEDLVRRLVQTRQEVERATRAALAVTFESVADTAPSYAALYRGEGSGQ